MTEYIQLIGLTLVGGLASLFGGVLLLRSKRSAEVLARYATPFAAGALLSAVFLDLLADGIEQAQSDEVLLAALVGMVLFFLAERTLRWFHHHHSHEDEADKADKPLIIIGDTMHNALDGVAIAAAFLVSPATGVVTAIAVAAHEIPQEIGDFGLLLSKGMSRRKVLLVNVLSALATTVTAIIVFALGDAEVLPIGWLLGLSAGFLLYIAASDIIPDIHRSSPKHKLVDWPVALFLSGVILVGVSIQIAHSYIHTEHNHTHEVTDYDHSHDEHHGEHEDEEDHHQDE